MDKQIAGKENQGALYNFTNKDYVFFVFCMRVKKVALPSRSGCPHFVSETLKMCVTNAVENRM